jgi:protein TonB
MAAKLLIYPMSYGLRYLHELYKKHLFVALTIAVILHLVAIGTYFLVNYFSNEEETVLRVRLQITTLPPPPSLRDDGMVIPPIVINTPEARRSIGIPVPVPDAEVRSDETIASQKELTEIQNSLMQSIGGPGTEVQLQQDINIEEPNPEIFIPVEKLPVPVKQVQPEYPEIARRAGVEGIVWVKILVDKEGKSKKAIIAKSDSEIFDELAIKAALQWVFTPAMMNNGPVAVWVTVPFRFKLNK